MKDRGIGTKLAEYIDRGAPTFCGACEYNHPRNQEHGSCSEPHMGKDSEVPRWEDGKPKVNLAHGCCRFWKPVEAKEPPHRMMLLVGLSGRKVK